MTTIFNRRVLLTTLDPVPRSFRTAPGVLAMNRTELEAFNDGDRVAVGMVVDLCQAADAAEARNIGVFRRVAVRRTRPSDRLFEVNAIYPGRI